MNNITARLRFQSLQPSARCSLRSLHGDGLSGSNPGAKVFPSWSERRKARGRSPGESEERRRTVRTAELSRFQPPVSRLRGARVSVSVPRGEGRLSGDISSWSHTRWSTADLSSCTAARSCEADWASFPTSVVGAIVGALGCASFFFFLIIIICFSFHLLTAPLCLCVHLRREETQRCFRAQIRGFSPPRWVFFFFFFWKCSLYLSSSSSLCALPDDFSSTGV